MMVDVDTGEVLAMSSKSFAMNFNTKNDAGFRTCMEWCMSCVRGLRNTNHKNLELRIGFLSENKQLPLFGAESLESLRLEASEYVR